MNIKSSFGLFKAKQFKGAEKKIHFIHTYHIDCESTIYLGNPHSVQYSEVSNNPAFPYF